jgi:pyruvate dehydrogenase E2 component (dihydrolipoamide acetyltransferase)
MPHPIQIPRLGWSMEQGTFVGWLKQNGEAIKPGDALFTLEGEKAIQEIEAIDTGSLHFDPSFPTEGDIVAVGAVIGYLLAAGETAPPIPRRRSPTDSPLAPSGRVAGSEGPSHPVQSRQSPLAAISSPQRGEEKRTAVASPAASPAVRRLARQLGIDLSQIDSAGRISEADVCRRYLQNRGELFPGDSAANSNVRSDVGVRATMAHASVPRRSRDLPAISPRAVRAAEQLGIDWSRLTGTGTSGRIRERDVLSAATPSRIAAPSRGVPTTDSPSASRAIRITPLRRTIASRMVASCQQTAPVTLTAPIDVTSIIGFREQWKRSGEEPVPSITDCFVKLVAAALSEHPMLNARWQDDAIELFDEMHIGVAVDTEDGLLVPVIRDVHRHSVLEIARQSRDLIEKTRARRLNAQDLQGGTFTISNLGSLGIDAFTPIINFPETAVLGLGRIQSRPTIALNHSAPDSSSSRQQTMTLSLTFDHRVLDGAPAARFLQTLARLATTDLQQLFGSTNHR